MSGLGTAQLTDARSREWFNGNPAASGVVKDEQGFRGRSDSTLLAMTPFGPRSRIPSICGKLLHPRNRLPAES